jgi:hypothetical protein
MNGRYWLLTIPAHAYTVYLPPDAAYIKGQLEIGEGTGFRHWQILVAFKSNKRLAAVKKIFGDGIHAELTRSEAANTYVWKDATAVPDTRFELGKLLLKRACEKDWEQILSAAKSGKFEDIPPDVYIRSYSAIKKIRADALEPAAIERTIHVFWGATGTGKSRRAWDEAGNDAYPKDPRSKFWDGYREHANVVIDEFRGGIDISHILRWFDRYPVIVEVKGSSTVLKATTIWITSNLHPDAWYPTVDAETKLALLRRLQLVQFE